jgi:polyisoprenoid-binding protein YceI
MKNALLLTLALTLSVMGSLFAQGHVNFVIKNAGISVDGTFEKFTVDINYDKENPNDSYFNGNIDVRTIDTDVSMRDEHLAKEEYFDTQNHPSITFKSSSVTATSGGNLKVIGTLTIKGISKKVELMVKVISEAGETYYVTNFELDRRDYEIGGNSWVMGDDVKCEIKAKATK